MFEELTEIKRSIMEGCGDTLWMRNALNETVVDRINDILIDELRYDQDDILDMDDEFVKELGGGKC